MIPAPLYYVYVMILRESTLHFWEYASLVCQYNLQTGKKSTDSRLLERGYTQGQIDAMNRKNHNILKSLNLQLTGGFEKNEHEYFDFYYSLFDLYEKGVMPFQGSPAEQPNKIIEIFGIFNALKIEYDKIQNEKMQREMRKRNKK